MLLASLAKTIPVASMLAVKKTPTSMLTANTIPVAAKTIAVSCQHISLAFTAI